MIDDLHELLALRGHDVSAIEDDGFEVEGTRVVFTPSYRGRLRSARRRARARRPRATFPTGSPFSTCSGAACTGPGESSSTRSASSAASAASSSSRDRGAIPAGSSKRLEPHSALRPASSPGACARHLRRPRSRPRRGRGRPSDGRTRGVPGDDRGRVLERLGRHRAVDDAPRRSSPMRNSIRLGPEVARQRDPQRTVKPSWLESVRARRAARASERPSARERGARHGGPCRTP